MAMCRQHVRQDYGCDNMVGCYSRQSTVNKAVVQCAVATRKKRQRHNTAGGTVQSQIDTQRDKELHIVMFKRCVQQELV
ncbi:hypothetical protein IV203_031897 [Nitzschia inconspicua]|uniref:Uncharacterized protein n=1 Tax=Nitzschia inconspicua TaxID=303405 RepID=A0A9K3LV67_9STRA|nr:hypothetical protein IV203_031897 [Nitzschia inconspicua]